MPTLNQPVIGPVRVVDRRRGRFLLVNAVTGAWGVVNRPGLLQLTESGNAPAVAGLRERLLEQAPTGVGPASTEPLFVIYKLTDTCNFRCVYCYDRRVARRKETSRRDTAVRAVLDDALAHGREPIHLLFHGGEPLEELPEIRSLLEEYSGYGPQRIQFSMQTNGSLLDAETVEILRGHRVGISVSVDGVTPAANALRIVGGRPDPYELLRQRIAEIDGLRADGLGLLLTVGRHNVAGLPDALLQMQADGFRSVSLSFMQEVGPGARGASPEALLAMLGGIVDRIVDGELAELGVWTLIEWARQLIERRAELTCMTSPCGAGRTVVTVLPSGEVGPCDSIFDPRYYAPDVTTYEELRTSSDSLLGRLVTRERHTHEPCRSCDVGPHCNGTCPGNAILQTGDPTVPADDECAFHYAWIRELMWILSDDHRGPGLRAYCERHDRERASLRAEVAL